MSYGVESSRTDGSESLTFQSRFLIDKNGSGVRQYGRGAI